MAEILEYNIDTILDIFRRGRVEGGKNLPYYKSKHPIATCPNRLKSRVKMLGLKRCWSCSYELSDISFVKDDIITAEKAGLAAVLDSFRDAFEERNNYYATAQAKIAEILGHVTEVEAENDELFAENKNLLAEQVRLEEEIRLLSEEVSQDALEHIHSMVYGTLVSADSSKPGSTSSDHADGECYEQQS